MISILIPIYNCNVNQLVSNLKAQADVLNKEYEIICLDDHSDESFKRINRSVSAYEHVSYTELNENIGRSKIRNLLAKKASNKFLLFLDCDLQIQDKDFLQKYLQNVRENAVVCGGIAYPKTAPSPESFLRWHYGTLRESIHQKERNKNPYKSFLSSNFLIDSKTFERINFDEKMIGYGHEDTLFGLELKAHNIPVIHIDNPAIHMGLEDAENFLLKSKHALKNLAYLYSKNISGLSEEIKILKWHETLKASGIDKIILLMFKASEKLLSKNLVSKKPLLVFFDFYKLGYFISLIQLQKSKK
jgi:glycosyltransferase involved in cell wall biosynthesis